MIGLRPLRFAMMGGAVTAVDFASSAVSSTSTITVPADIEAGDVAVLFDVAGSDSSTNPTTTVPTDFTLIVNNVRGAPNNNGRGICSYKRLDGSEGSTDLTGMSGVGAGTTTKILAVFRPNRLPGLISLSTPSGSAGDGNPAAQTLAMAAAAGPLIGIAAYSSTGAIDPRTATGATFSELNNGTTMYLKYCLFNAGDVTADASIDMDDEGFNNILQSFFIRLF